MHRFLYFAGFAFIALCGAVVVRSMNRPGVLAKTKTESTIVVAPSPTPLPSSSGAQWFATMKPFCNQVEVDVRIRYTPPPSTSAPMCAKLTALLIAAELE